MESQHYLTRMKKLDFKDNHLNLLKYSGLV